MIGMKSGRIIECELCKIERLCTFHHLIPKTNHSNKWFKKNFSKEEMNKGAYICKYLCHKEVHNLISEKDLGRNYNTIEKLLDHEKVTKYVSFIKKH